MIAYKLKIAEATRYLYWSKYCKRELDVFVLDVPEDSIPPSVANSVSDDIGGNPQCENYLSHLNESKFRRKYCMSRKNVHSLLGLIKDHPVFDPRDGYKRRGPIQSPKNQLLTMMHCQFVWPKFYMELFL